MATNFLHNITCMTFSDACVFKGFRFAKSTSSSLVLVFFADLPYHRKSRHRNSRACTKRAWNTLFYMRHVSDRFCSSSWFRGANSKTPATYLWCVSILVMCSARAHLKVCQKLFFFNRCQAPLLVMYNNILDLPAKKKSSAEFLLNPGTLHFCPLRSRHGLLILAKYVFCSRPDVSNLSHAIYGSCYRLSLQLQWICLAQCLPMTFLQQSKSFAIAAKFEKCFTFCSSRHFSLWENSTCFSNNLWCQP